MEETKAISPEVKGLFDTIKSQAKEYEKAFKYIEIEKLKLEQQRKDLDRLMDELRNEVSYTTLKLNQKVQDSLSFIETRTEKTIKIYDNLENIVDLRDSLSQLHGLVKKQVSEVENFLKVEIPKTLKEFDNLLKNVKVKSESELENILINFRQKFEKYLETETQKLDQKNAIKFKQQETRLITLEQKLNSLFDTHQKDIKRTLEEFTELRNKVSSASFYGEDKNEAAFNRLTSQLETLSRKQEQITNTAGEIESWKRGVAGQFESARSGLEKLDYLISSLSAKVALQENGKNKNDIRQNTALALSIISTIGVFVLILKALGLF